MTRVLTIFGLLAIALGIIWIGQGTGYGTALSFWPKNPVMDNQMPWAYGGGALVAFGLILLWLPRRR